MAIMTRAELDEAFAEKGARLRELQAEADQTGCMDLALADYVEDQKARIKTRRAERERRR